MALILAIEPDARQAAHIAAIARHRVGAELMLAGTTEQALDKIGDRVPDLVLVPALLSPQDDAALAGALRIIATAAHVRTLTIPVLASGPKHPPAAEGMLAKWRRGKASSPAPDGCDPAIFAEQISEYLREAAAERAALEPELDDDLDEEPIAEAFVDAEPEAAAAIEAAVIEAAEIESAAIEPPAMDFAAMEAAAIEALPMEAAAIEAPPIESAPIDLPAAEAQTTEAQTIEAQAAPAEVATAFEPDWAAMEADRPVFPVFEPRRAVFAARIESLIDEPPAAPVLPTINETSAAEPARVSAAHVDPPPAVVDESWVELELAEARDKDTAPNILEVEVSHTIASPLDNPDLRATSAPLELLEPVEPVEQVEPVDEDATIAEIFSALRGLDRFVVNETPAPPQRLELWMPLTLGGGLRWPRLEGMVAERVESAPRPAPVDRPARAAHKPERAEKPEWSALIASLRQDIERLRHDNPAAITTLAGAKRETPAPAPRPVNAPRKGKVVRGPAPVQDEWGFFDPDQCGFAALLAKLNEITDASDESDARSR